MKRFLFGVAYCLGFAFWGALLGWWLSLTLDRSPPADPAEPSARTGAPENPQIQQRMADLEDKSFDLWWLAVGAAAGAALGLLIARSEDLSDAPEGQGA